MAASVAISFGPDVPGSRRHSYGTITFDSSYDTGGEAITLAQLGLSRLDWLEVSSGTGYLAAWDGSTSTPKVLLYRQTAATGALVEVPSTTNVSTVTVKFRATGA
jgi:hypothetical protein